ncbi:methionyl aminopeptidase [Panaeolus papilionaceus]|nr:methionyl aminopeptidase [Panaeolus papilionaceus]
MLRLTRWSFGLRSNLGSGPGRIISKGLRVRRYATVNGEEESYEDFGQYSIILPEEPFQFGVSHIKPRTAPHNIVKPDYVLQPHPSQHNITIRSPGKIKLNGEEEMRIRKAAKLAKKVREFAGSLVQVGVTTNEIDRKIHDFIIRHQAYPSPLLYSGFPRSCCTSINNIIAHGIPDDRPLEDGDIVNIDVTVYFDGFHGDTSQTFLVGNVDEPGRELVEITNMALEQAISICQPGRPFKDIAQAIQDLIGNKNYSVSPQFTGHGIGKVFHSPPWILHHPNDEPGVMQPGHSFTIEPAIIQGTNPRGWIFPDGWTASTENCARSAQAEHMVLITENGAEVLTK